MLTLFFPALTTQRDPYTVKEALLLAIFLENFMLIYRITSNLRLPI